MSSLGVNTLQTRCSGQCLITLQDTSKAGDKAIRMTDGRGYYIYAISGYVKSLIRRGMNIGHPNFVLPTRIPITAMDLQLLHINPVDVAPAIPAPFEADNVFIPIQGNDDMMYTIHDIRTRWGCLLHHNSQETFLVTTVQQVDRFILPRDYDPNFDHDNDDNIRTRRIRNLGSEELELLIHGIEQPGAYPPANTRLAIMYEWNFYDTYAELSAEMGIPEVQVANLEAAPFMRALLSQHLNQ
jgi:hypothetical protein